MKKKGFQNYAYTPLDSAILEAFIYLNATKNNILIIVLIFVLFNLIGSQIRKIVFL